MTSNETVGLKATDVVARLSQFVDDPRYDINMVRGVMRDARDLLSRTPSSDVLETERLRDLLDTERYKVAIGVQAIARAVQGRQWLSQPGRGSYTYDDERYQQEFGAALDEILEALKPLHAVAQDWSDCPRDPLRVAANRDTALSKVGKQ